MGRVRALRVSCLVVVATATTAHAQQAGGPPGESRPASLVAPEATYPQELVLRPLLLPRGGLEGSALFTLQTIDVGGIYGDRKLVAIEPHLRFGFGIGEVEVATSLLAYETEAFAYESERLQRLLLAARFKVSPRSVVGVELSVRDLLAEFPVYSPRAVAGTKLHLSPASALELAFKTGFDRTSRTDVQAKLHTVTTLIVTGEVRVQAQLSPEVAFEGRALLGYSNEDDGPMVSYTPGDAYFVHDYGVRLVGSLGRGFDLSAGFDVLRSTESATVKLFSIGVAARRLP